MAKAPLKNACAVPPLVEIEWTDPRAYTNVSRQCGDSLATGTVAKLLSGSGLLATRRRTQAGGAFSV